MEFLTNLLDNTQYPVLAALILGLMMAISPCPLATNISAIGYISKDLSSRRRIFLNGLLYTLGRTISYTVLGIILIIILNQGASIFRIQRAIGTYGEMFIGPLLILIGVFMMGWINLNFSLGGKMSEKAQAKAGNGSLWGSLLLGIVFALAFCPYSGILYFGGVIPMAAASSTGILMLVVFAIATGLPVIIFAWILAYSVAGIGSMYNKIKTFEYWFRRIVAVLFIGVGLYYCYIVFLK